MKKELIKEALAKLSTQKYDSKIEYDVIAETIKIEIMSNLTYWNKHRFKLDKPSLIAWKETFCSDLKEMKKDTEEIIDKVKDQNTPLLSYLKNLKNLFERAEEDVSDETRKMWDYSLHPKYSLAIKDTNCEKFVQLKFKYLSEHISDYRDVDGFIINNYLCIIVENLVLYIDDYLDKKLEETNSISEKKEIQQEIDLTKIWLKIVNKLSFDEKLEIIKYEDDKIREFHQEILPNSIKNWTEQVAEYKEKQDLIDKGYFTNILIEIYALFTMKENLKLDQTIRDECAEDIKRLFELEKKIPENYAKYLQHFKQKMELEQKIELKQETLSKFIERNLEESLSVLETRQFIANYFVALKENLKEKTFKNCIVVEMRISKLLVIYDTLRNLRLINEGKKRVKILDYISEIIAKTSGKMRELNPNNKNDIKGFCDEAKATIEELEEKFKDLLKEELLAPLVPQSTSLSAKDSEIEASDPTLAQNKIEVSLNQEVKSSLDLDENTIQADSTLEPNPAQKPEKQPEAENVISDPGEVTKSNLEKVSELTSDITVENTLLKKSFLRKTIDSIEEFFSSMVKKFRSLLDRVSSKLSKDLPNISEKSEEQVKEIVIKAEEEDLKIPNITPNKSVKSELEVTKNDS